MSLPAWAIRAAGSVVNVGLLALFVVVFVGAISAASEGKEPAWANDKVRVAFATGLASYVGGIVASFVPGGVKWLRIGLALGFALVYFGVSAWAVIVWFQSPLNYNVPDMVKNLVSVSVGLAFLLGRSVFYEES
jgi:hypothetical protein